VMQVPNNPKIQLDVTIFWESILPKYFDRFYTHKHLELELELAGG